MNECYQLYILLRYAELYFSTHKSYSIFGCFKILDDLENDRKYN